MKRHNKDFDGLEAARLIYGPPDVPDVPLSVRNRADDYYAARRVERAVDAELKRRRADT